MLVLRETVVRDVVGRPVTESTKNEIGAFATRAECSSNRTLLTGHMWRELGGKGPIGDIPRADCSP